MSEKLLCLLLNNGIQLPEFKKWLLNHDDIDDFHCSRGEFVSYFLNYIHNVPILNNKKKPEAKPVEKQQTVPKRLSINHEPMSPIYNGNSQLKTPKNRTQPKQLTLSDFMAKSSNKNRRINPTNLSRRKLQSSFNRCENSFNFANVEEISPEQEDITRELLVKESKKLSREMDKLEIRLSESKQKIEIEPDPNLVHSKDRVDVLIGVYDLLLCENFILNLCSEMNFLITLLLSKIYRDEEEDCFVDDSLLTSIHNCVYFATKVLSNRLELLQETMDKGTLKLLGENPRIREFSPGFASTLKEIAQTKIEVKNELETAATIMKSSVYFSLDTDNKEMFSSTTSFQAFRKQRDLFYEILRIWENNYLHSEWNFQLALSGKIKTLLNISLEPANFVHLARLFKSQLLMNVCGGGNKSITEENVEELEFPSGKCNIPADKLQRLKNRFTTKQYEGNVLDFYGHEEFFRNFLTVASNHIFYKHLMDCFIYEINELTDTKFNTEDEDVLNDTTRKSYVFCIKSLEVLAKFLGFLESLPYKTNGELPENVVANEILLRKRIQPQMDLFALIQKSVSDGNLILTIPWISKYLSMLDFVTLRLPFMEKVLQLLFEIYGKSNRLIPIARNSLLVRLSLGSLFDLAHFPQESYYGHLDAEMNPIAITESKNDHRIPLDCTPIVNVAIVNMSCPYLEKIGKMLSDHRVTSITNFKHITPISSIQSSTDLANKKLQIQLEEAFFNSQASSIRKIVEFVSERVASSCVKEICNELVPEAKSVFSVRLREELQLIDKSDKKFLEANGSKLIANSLERLHRNIKSHVATMIKSKVTDGVLSLLSNDLLSQSKDVCVGVAARTCTEKVDQWIDSHVNAAIFQKGFDAEMKKIDKNPPKCIEPIIDTDQVNPIEIIDLIKDYCCGLIEENSTIDKKSIEEVIESIGNRRSNHSVQTVLARLFLDFIILLAVHKQELFSKDLIDKFVTLYKSFSIETDAIFKNIISARNILLLAQSSNRIEAWNRISILLNRLLKENLLSSDSFESQCLFIYKRRWDEQTLRNLSSCFRTVIDGQNRATKFTILMQFLSEFCADL